jgi:hypothetical protein
VYLRRLIALFSVVLPNAEAASFPTAPGAPSGREEIVMSKRSARSRGPLFAVCSPAYGEIFVGVSLRDSRHRRLIKQRDRACTHRRRRRCTPGEMS